MVSLKSLLKEPCLGHLRQKGIDIDGKLYLSLLSGTREEINKGNMFVLLNKSAG
jgi:hypothetical protein